MAPLLKTLLFTLVVPGTVAVLIPVHLSDMGPPGWHVAPGRLRWIGVPLIAFGGAVYLRCAWDFAMRGRGTPSPTDPPRTLVAGGIYRYSRNPMYVGISAVLLGEAVYFGSLAVLAYSLLIVLAFHLRVIYYEEPVLVRSFGTEYQQYRQNVPRWLGRLERRHDAAP